ncbi:hypothetical protein TNCV_2170791 [Trichonephila clavipes]|nr:hypothetical protein TNCV_2170791 [Trichonephila clavipes]
MKHRCEAVMMNKVNLAKGCRYDSNHIGKQGRKCLNCELWCKEVEKRNRNSNTLIGQKIFPERLYYNRCSKVYGLLLLESHRVFDVRETPVPSVEDLTARISVAAERMHDMLKIFQNRVDNLTKTLTLVFYVHDSPMIVAKVDTTCACLAVRNEIFCLRAN